MAVFLLRRAVSGALTLLAWLPLSFFRLRAAPGGPLDRERSLPPSIEAAMAAQYHLDQPLWRQYLHYAGNALRGDLGPSFQYAGYQVTELIAPACRRRCCWVASRWHWHCRSGWRWVSLPRGGPGAGATSSSRP